MILIYVSFLLQSDSEVKEKNGSEESTKKDVKDKNETAESAEDEEEWDVEEIKDYKWCRATVRP